MLRGGRKRCRSSTSGLPRPCSVWRIGRTARVSPLSRPGPGARRRSRAPLGVSESTPPRHSKPGPGHGRMGRWGTRGEDRRTTTQQHPTPAPRRGIARRHATGPRERFPLDCMLSDLGVDSYAGTPLRGVDGQAQGLLVIDDTDRPMDASRHHPCTILDLVAGRAAAELERSRVEEQLRKSEEQIRFLSESTPALLWTGHARWPPRLPIATRS